MSQNPSRTKKIVVIGGGTGLPVILKELKNHNTDITAIVTVADDGGGSGRLRQDLGMLPPGDIRNCLEALANAEPLMAQLMHYRFPEGELAGQSFGNLFLAALNGIMPSFDRAVESMSQVLAITGRVLPVTTADVQLEATFENGASVVGESHIFRCKKEQDCRIRRVRLIPEHPRALPAAVEALEKAEVIVLAPGSLYTSIIPNLLVDGIVDAIRRSRAGLSDPNRPIGSFLFLGPTGVGKTELCKALAEYLFDSQDAMVRIDMSEFMEKHSVARLVGAPPGYVGYEEGGYLTEAVRRKPYSVILLDEVEKAHPDVFNILLQVLDDGRLTDGQGRTVDFRNAVVIMTSNLGSDLIQEQHGSSTYDEMKLMVLDVLSHSFRPEFLNRIDETVVFHPLSREHIESIARIQLDGLLKRLEGMGYKVELRDALLSHLAAVGFDPVFGARPLKRAIQQEVENPLAQAILSGKASLAQTLVLDLQDDKFILH